MDYNYTVIKTEKEQNGEDGRLQSQNYKALKDIALGKFWNEQGAKTLTPMAIVIGKNGVDKSTLFDTFGFLADCLKLGVEAACDLRGGFEKIRTGRTPL